MDVDDLILVSVDDHVVEPPDMFEGHIPARYRDQAPKVVTKPDGTDAWVFEGQEATNVGLNAVAGRPPDEYGVEPTRFDEIRPGCFDIHERIRDMNANGVLASMNFPSYPAHLGPEPHGRGDPAGGEEGLPRRHLLREPREAGLPIAAQRALGPVLGRLLRREQRSCASTSGPRHRSSSPPSTRRSTR
jgi:hypothetical protein